MNNKGMTLVELLVTFSLLMVIVVGMFNLILDVKLDLDTKQTSKSFIEYSDLINKDIHTDIIKNGPYAIAIKKVSTGKWRCAYSSEYTFDNDCAITGDTFNPVVSKIKGSKEINITGTTDLSNICNDLYPCAVYAYYDQNNSSDNVTAKFKVIAISKSRKNEVGFGIKYGNTFEKIPNQKYVNFLKSNPSIKFENGFFVIDYPLYTTGDDNNYGFKIAYPFD